MVIVGCEPNLNSQQITQGAQNLRENVRNIDTQKITQGAQNLRENVRNIDTQKIAQGAQNLKENLQNFAGSSAVENKSSNPTPESLKNTDPVLAEILGDVLADDQVQVDRTKQNVEELDTTRLSDENDFDAVSERQSIESDAERIEKNRALYVLIEPTSLPRRPGSQIPSIVEYAIKTTNPVGMQL